MTVGLSAVNLANAWLSTLRGGGNGVSFTAPASTHVKLHIADPGAAGATAPSAETDRMALEYAAPSGASMASSNEPSWGPWDQGTETISDISVWDDATAGNFLYSAELTTPREVQDNDTLNLTSVTFALTPVAA
jgi:hypothetical protein